MTFLLLMLGFSLLAYIPQFFLGDRKDYRMALRHGMAGGFIFTGIDHFISAHARYVPMMPDFLADYAFELVYFTGAAELAGAIGLVIPLAVYHRLGLPNLRKWAGIGIVIMLIFLVIANINVAWQGAGVHGFEFGAWYYWVRLIFQPIFILWALYVSGVIWEKEAKTHLPKPRIGLMKRMLIIFGVMAAAFSLTLVNLTILPSKKINDEFAAGIAQAANFRKTLLRAENRQAKVIAAALPGMVKKRLSTGKELDAAYFLEAMQGTSANLDNEEVFQNFSGNWQGKWKRITVQHCWEVARDFTFPRHIEPDHASPRIKSLQYAWVGDGYGWNVIAIPPDKFEASVILGVVYHLDKRQEVVSKIPHVGIAITPFALVWVTPRDIFFEQILHEPDGDKIYKIEAVSYKMAGDKLSIQDEYETRYRYLGPAGLEEKCKESFSKD